MIRPAIPRRKYWIGIALTAAFFLALELFRLPVIVCLLVYLTLYVVAPFWTPVKDGERGKPRHNALRHG
jgi:hypothetical protein